MPTLRELFTGRAIDPLREFDPALAPLPSRMFDHRLHSQRKPLHDNRQHTRHAAVRANTLKGLSAALALRDKPLSPQENASAQHLRNRIDARSAGAIIRATRERMQRNAIKYLAQHDQVIAKAIASEDPKALETARRATQWSLESISAEENGRVERVVEKEVSTANGPSIKIGIALGGMHVEHDDAADAARARFNDVYSNVRTLPHTDLPTPALPIAPIDAPPAEILSTPNDNH